MRTLMVSPFAPYRDGIATYAIQELRELRSNRQPWADVDVLSPLPSAARWHLRLGGPRGMVRLAAKAKTYDRTIIHFAPDMLFGGCGSAARRLAVWAGLAGLARSTSLDLRIHEIEYGPLEQNPLERRAARLAFEQADRVTVHTPAEGGRLDELLGIGDLIEVIDHGRDFRAAVVLSPAEARAELGLSQDHFLFVAIGFLQHHKGFDLAVEAIERLPATDARLHIVGSARVDEPEITDYVDRLARQSAAVPAATLHQRFVSDVEFDLWLQAADAVVLPYREIWSSGVVERARLFETPILASDLPQLRDQAPPGTLFFADVDELSIAMEKLSAAADVEERGGTGDPSTDPAGADGAAGSAASDDSPWRVDRRHPDRNDLQAQIVARAREDQIATAELGPGSAIDRRPVDPLLALGHLHRPQPTSARPGVAPVKRAVERLTNWQIEPVARRVEELQRAAIDAVTQLDRRLDEPVRPGAGGTDRATESRATERRATETDGAKTDSGGSGRHETDSGETGGDDDPVDDRSNQS